MKRYASRYLLGLAILLVLLAHTVGAFDIPIIGRLDAIIYDVKIRLTMPQSIDERIVILDIDEKSLAEQGHWPWGRDTMARLLDILFDQHSVRVVGMDVMFPETDASSGLPALEALAKGELSETAAFQKVMPELRKRLDFDGRFANAMRGRPVVLGYYLSNGSASQTAGVLPAPTLPAGIFSNRRSEFTTWQSYGANLGMFQQAAAGAGHFNPIVDFDGMARRVPMIVEYKDQYYESLSLAMMRVLRGNAAVLAGFPDMGGNEVAMEWLDLKPAEGNVMRIPVDRNAASLIPFRGYRGSFPYFSVTDVLNGRVNADALKGRIVLIGTSAAGLMDLRATPVDAAYPGVEMHANLISGMLDDTLKYKPDYAQAADVLLLLAAGLVLVIGLPRLSPLPATWLALGVLCSLLLINLVSWHSANFVLPLAAGLTAVALLYALNMSWGYFIESRSKRQFAELFGQYVPPELVAVMAQNPESYSMHGRRAVLSVLFSDIRGFTTISESLAPDELTQLMNEYLGAMTEVIRQHRGTLDKYIGDAIMAFWGAPVDDERHATHAVQTALDMQRALSVLNTKLQAKGWPELQIGVGINSGQMIVGDMGSPVRKAYTVMGDAVNLASRLEGLTKYYGVGIMVGEETHKMLGKAFVFRELDRVRVKGKAEPVGIYEPLAEAGAPDAGLRDELKLWNQALRQYRDQDWEQAELSLMNLSRLNPRYIYTLYAKRIQQLRQEPPGEGWDGVTTFETK